MELVHTIEGLQSKLLGARTNGKSIGFVPTMGALHKGHISLVKKSIEENDITVVSIFVNPTQFNDKKDFLKYPRNIDLDSLLLEKVGVDFIFVPNEKEIYPEPDTRQFDFGMLDKVMEGEHRPGHFNGVAQVVSKLFDIVKPDTAYFGEKDFQQLAIIRAMVRQLNLPVRITGMPIMREESGLAMSSRNERLTTEQRLNASKMQAHLIESLNGASGLSVKETTQYVIQSINKEEDLRVEYFEIVDGDTLQPISEWKDTEYAVGCVAVFCGEVRLIDNITYYHRLKN